MTDANPYAAFIQLLNEIARAYEADAIVAALSLVYVGIDTMALLSCPVDKKAQTRTDFIGWVDGYLEADATEEIRVCGQWAAPQG